MSWTRWAKRRPTLDFEQAYDDNVHLVFGFFAYRMLRRQDAEDLTQQTFERALRGWSTYDPARAHVRTWLSAIARNVLVDHYRRAKGQLEAPLSPDQLPAELEPAIDDSGAAGGVEPRLAAALAELSPRDREIVALRYGADLTGPEIARATGLSLANVQQILSRSLRRLRSSLGAKGFGGARQPHVDIDV